MRSIRRTRVSLLLVLTLTTFLCAPCDVVTRQIDQVRSGRPERLPLPASPPRRSTRLLSRTFSRPVTSSKILRSCPTEHELARFRAGRRSRRGMCRPTGGPTRFTFDRCDLSRWSADHGRRFQIQYRAGARSLTLIAGRRRPIWGHRRRSPIDWPGTAPNVTGVVATRGRRRFKLRSTRRGRISSPSSPTQPRLSSTGRTSRPARIGSRIPTAVVRLISSPTARPNQRSSLAGMGATMVPRRRWRKLTTIWGRRGPNVPVSGGEGRHRAAGAWRRTPRDGSPGAVPHECNVH